MDKKYYEETFKIEGYDHSFRFKKIKPTKLLSITTLFSDKDDPENMEKIFDFALESTEVLLIDKWSPVLEYAPNGDSVYWPADLEDNLRAVNAIVSLFIKNVLSVVFTKSSKSTK